MQGANAADQPATEFRLLRHFTWACAIILGVVLVLFGLVVVQVIRQTFLDVEKNEANSFSEEIILRLKTSGYETKDWKDIPKEELANPELALKFENYNIIEFSLLSIDGAVIATAGSEVANQGLWQEGFRHAKSGHVASHWESENWMPFLFPMDRKEGWIETYLPVREGSSVIGIIRLRRDFGKLIADEFRVIPKLMAISLAGLCMIFSTLWMVIYKADRLIKRQRTQIEDRNKRLQDLDRRKDEFLAICSHDIRSPLISVYAGSQLLLREKTGPLNDLQQGIVQRNIQTVNTVVNLTNELLDLARIDAGQEALNLERFNLTDAVDESIAAYRTQAEAGNIVFEVRRPDSHYIIEADKPKILRVCNNLISNAIKHSPPGGTVTVAVDIQADQARLTVEDRGQGIDPENMKLLFDRFTSLSGRKKNREEGTGLGLSIVLGLVALHGGTIEVASAIGKGTTFVVRLPLRSGSPISQPGAVNA